MADGASIVPELIAAIVGLFGIVSWLVKERISRDGETIGVLQAKVWELIAITNSALPLLAESIKDTGTVVHDLKDIMRLQAVKDEAREDANAQSVREKAGRDR